MPPLFAHVVYMAYWSLSMQGPAYLLYSPEATGVFVVDRHPLVCGVTLIYTGYKSGNPHWARCLQINKVTSGYRITLTYNLYADPMPKDRPLSSKLDMAATALYQYLQEALANPGFLPDGGVLGFGCQHAYPHTDQDFCSRLTTMLKGADAVIYATAKQLGLDAGMSQWLSHANGELRHRNHVSAFVLNTVLRG